MNSSDIIKVGETTKLDFFKKKVAVSYFLSVLVFFIHISSFAQYKYSDDIVSRLLINFHEITVNFARVAVPFFFMLSGLLFFRHFQSSELKRKLKSRVSSIVVPYILWNIIGVLFAAVTTYFLADFFVGREKFTFSVPSLLEGVFLYKYNGQFWFMADLIILIAISPLLFITLKNKIVSLITLAVSIVLFITDITPHYSLVFYYMGCFIGYNYFDKVQETTKNYFIPAFILICCNVFLYFTEWDAIWVIEPVWLFKLLQILNLSLFCWSFWQLCDIFYYTKSREFYNYSFWVYALHPNVGGVFTKLLYIGLPKLVIFSIVNWLLTIILTLLTINGIAKLCKRYIPGCYRLLSGAR